MIEGVDFAYGRPSGASLVAAGKKFVVRYIGVSDSDGRALEASEVKDYFAHGLPICLVFESTSGRALGGRTAGVADARLSVKRMAALDVPDYVPMYFAVDFNARPDQYGTVGAYLQGAASVLGAGRVGVYGHADLLRYCRANKVAAWFWQTYAWSGGSQFVGRHLYQYNNGEHVGGAGVDFDRAYGDNYGQWSPIPVAPPSDVEANAVDIVQPGRKLTAWGGRGIFLKPEQNSALLVRNTVAGGEGLRILGNSDPDGWQLVESLPGSPDPARGWIRNEVVQDFRDGGECPECPPVVPCDCTDEVAAAVKVEHDKQEARIAGIKQKVAATNADVQND